MNNQGIFKSYDIRGIYPDELDDELVFNIGRAFVDFLERSSKLNCRKIAIGRDIRLSSKSLFDALSQGVISKSVDVVNIGLVSTPLFYWAVINKKIDGGIMITASHNPGQYNGMKLCGRNARPIGSETGLLKIQEIAESNLATPITAYPGKIETENLLGNYLNFIGSRINFNKMRPMKIIIDCGNGMIGPEISVLSKKIAGEIKILFGEPDGNFPNHEPNPLKAEALQILKETVLNEKADLGVAFDGDGDRVSFLDERGEVIRGDYITALIAKELLKDEPGQKILYEVRSSRAVLESIKENGGRPVLGRAGHSLIKEQMRKEDILFAGELSGHYFFKELGFIDNAIFAMLKILEIIGDSNKSLSELAGPLKKYQLSGEINFEIQDKKIVLDKIENFYKSNAANIIKVDGLTMEFSKNGEIEWWFNLRPSNTEPFLRLNIEARTAEVLTAKKEEISRLISSA